jgi:hypothetical protein
MKKDAVSAPAPADLQALIDERDAVFRAVRDGYAEQKPKLAELEQAIAEAKNSNS